MKEKRVLVVILFVLFIITQTAYLTTVPALSGDEASEGENIIELWSGKKFILEGERSYIGVLIDYVRMPFVLVFGHTTLALRLVTLLSAITSFWLAWSIGMLLFGEKITPWILVALFFSPVYILETRISWAITLSLFFALLTIYLLLKNTKHAPLLAGLSAGLGIHNHFLFVPTAVAIFSTWVIIHLRRPRQLLAIGLICIGIIAGVSTQLVMLVQDREGDQGEQTSVLSSVGERVSAFPSLAPHIISSSSFIARYTGHEMSWTAMIIVSALVIILALVPLMMSGYRYTALLWLLGTAIHLTALLLIIDRFSLRYFVIFVISLWALAGLGVGLMVIRWPRLTTIGPLILAGGLSVWMILAVLIPYRTTGGSTLNFSLGNRTDSASALVDTQPLLNCIQNQGSVFTENIHIFNRLQYIQHSVPTVTVSKNKETARWLVDYRFKDQDSGDLCPELINFGIHKSQ